MRIKRRIDIFLKYFKPEEIIDIIFPNSGNVLKQLYIELMKTKK